MPPVLALSLGGPEMIWIFVIVLLLFGAKKLPELARGVGKSMGEFKKARDEFEHEITRAETDTRKETPKPKTVTERPLDESDAVVREVPGKEPRES
jgi:sec-independent protein translocase protein TatA